MFEVHHIAGKNRVMKKSNALRIVLLLCILSILLGLFVYANGLRIVLLLFTLGILSELFIYPEIVMIGLVVVLVLLTGVFWVQFISFISTIILKIYVCQ